MATAPGIYFTSDSPNITAADAQEAYQNLITTNTTNPGQTSSFVNNVITPLLNSGYTINYIIVPGTPTDSQIYAADQANNTGATSSEPIAPGALSITLPPDPGSMVINIVVTDQFLQNAYYPTSGSDDPVPVTIQQNLVHELQNALFETSNPGGQENNETDADNGYLTEIYGNAYAVDSDAGSTSGSAQSLWSNGGVTFVDSDTELLSPHDIEVFGNGNDIEDVSTPGFLPNDAVAPVTVDTNGMAVPVPTGPTSVPPSGIGSYVGGLKKGLPPSFDPLVVDLTGDGIQTTSVDSITRFDEGNDGFAQATAWVGPGTGILVDDPTDAPITNGSQLFGSSTSLTGGGYSSAVLSPCKGAIQNERRSQRRKNSRSTRFRSAAGQR